MKSVFVRGNGCVVTPGTQSPRVLKRCAQVTQETRVFLPCEYRSDFSRFIIFLLRVRRGPGSNLIGKHRLLEKSTIKIKNNRAYRRCLANWSPISHAHENATTEQSRNARPIFPHGIKEYVTRNFFN